MGSLVDRHSLLEYGLVRGLGNWGLVDDGGGGGEFPRSVMSDAQLYFGAWL